MKVSMGSRSATNSRTLRTVLSVAALMLTSGSALSADLFVRVTGNDKNTGRSATAALRSLQSAINLAQPGDTVYIGAGVYKGPIKSSRAGTYAGRITLRGDTDGSRTGDAGQITITTDFSETLLNIAHDGWTITNLNFSSGSQAVRWSGRFGTIIGCDVRASQSYGVEITSGDLTIHSSSFRNGADAGVQVSGGVARIESNTFKSCGGPGIRVIGPTASATITANTIIDNAGCGIEFADAARAPTLVVSNLIANNRLGGVVSLSEDPEHPTMHVWNNTLVRNGVAGLRQVGGLVSFANNIVVGSPTGILVEGGISKPASNLYWECPTTYKGIAPGTNDLIEDPRFLNPNPSDILSDLTAFSLQPNSPAIDSAVISPALPRTDRRGQVRGSGKGWERGAFEMLAPAATIPYNTDFEIKVTETAPVNPKSGTINEVPAAPAGSVQTRLGPEWNRAKLNADELALTRFLGSFADEGPTLRLETTPGTKYAVTFDLYTFNGWAGSNIYLGPDLLTARADAKIVWRESFSSRPSDPAYSQSSPVWPERWGTPLRAGSTVNTKADAVFRAVRFEFTATAPVTTLTLIAEGLSSGRLTKRATDVDSPKAIDPDERWGIDNLRVTFADEPKQSSRFTESARHIGFATTLNGIGAGGLLVADVNNDGYQDCIIAGTPAQLLLNTSASTHRAFVLTDTLRLTSTETGKPVPLASIAQPAWIDADRDGDPDLAILAYERATTTSRSGILTWQTVGEPRATILVNSRTPASASSALPQFTPGIFLPQADFGKTLATLDLNADGATDVFSPTPTGGNWAFLNPNRAPQPSATPASTPSPAAPTDATFSPLRNVLPSGAADAGNGDLAITGDVNGDGIADVFYQYNGGRLFLSQRAANNSVSWVSVDSGIRIRTQPGVRNGAMFFDYDNDSDLDLLICNRESKGTPSLYTNNGKGLFTLVEDSAGIKVTATSTVCSGDADNDGDLDVFFTTAGGRTAYFRNEGATADRPYTFLPMNEGTFTQSMGGDCTFADMDNDGDLDLLMSDETAVGSTTFFTNNTNDDRSLTVRVKGTRSIAPLGIGTRVELWNGPATICLGRRDIGAMRGYGQEPLVAHFGGLDPAQNFTLKVFGPTAVFTTTVCPARATSRVGDTTIERCFTFEEPANLPANVQLSGYEEVPDDGNK